MCYFDQIRWACGYWRWSHFREQCDREWRIGETCGLKFVNELHEDPSICKLCSEMERKQRKIDKMEKDIARWRKEGNRQATIERTGEALSHVLQQMRDLQDKHERDINDISVSRRKRECWDDIV